jgi:POT family proton-dependent oligopeptide transporter
MQNNPGFKQPGVLGLGQSRATAISTFFSLYVNIIPLFGAIIADNYLGCYNTLQAAFWCDSFRVIRMEPNWNSIYLAGVITLVVTSIPALMSPSTSLGGFISGIILLGIGVGGVRATLNTFIGISIFSSAASVS